VKHNWRILLVFVAVLTIVPAGVIGGVWLFRNSDVITFDSVEGGALVSGDGRTIAVTGDGMLCDQVITLHAVEAEATVTLDLRNAQPRRPQCAGMTGYAVYRVRLSLPLGRRRLIDGVTGKPVPYLDVKAIRRPAYVPPGYVFRYDEPVARGFPFYPQPPVTIHGRVSCSEVFSTREDHWLVITQQPVGPVRWPATFRLRAVTVQGHRALTYAGLLTWIQDGLRFTVRSDAGPPLPLSELLAIASSIPR
jgi:hypothetical protein